MTASQKQVLQIEVTEKDAPENILPRSPLLSSDSLQRKEILVQHHHQPAWEMLEYLASLRTLSIQHLTHPIEPERVLDGIRTEQLHEEDVALIPADVAYRNLWQRDCSFTLLMLDPAYVARLADEAMGRVEFELLPHFAKSDPLIYQIGAALKSELEFNQPSAHLYIDSLVAALTAHLVRHYSTTPPVDTEANNGLSKCQLDQAIAHIEAHLTEELNLSNLSDAVGVSKFYFCRLFKQSTGTTPHQYVIQQRVERAKQLLQQPQLSIADIALECGFANQSHLNRYFKRIVGVTPLAFRKQ